MNIRLQKIKALSILLLVSISAYSYSMQHLRNACSKVYPPIVAAAGLGTLAYQMYNARSAQTGVEQSLGSMIVVTPPIAELPIAAPAYVVPVDPNIPTEHILVQVNALGKAEHASHAQAYAPEVTISKKQVTWADEQGLAHLNRIREFKSSKSALAKYEIATPPTEENRPSNAVAIYKGSLAQSKRTPSRKSRANNQVAVVASQEVVPFVAVGAIAAQRSEAMLTKAQAQIAQFNRLAQEAQAARAAQIERKKKMANASHQAKR